MAWIYIVALLIAASIFLRLRFKAAKRQGINASAACFEPGNLITFFWLAWFVVEASLVLLNPANSQPYLAALSPQIRAQAVAQAVLYGLAGYLAFATGYLLPMKRLTVRMPYFPINHVTPAVRRLVVWIFLVCGIVGILIFGLGTLVGLLQHEFNKGIVTRGEGYLFVLIEAWSIGLIIAYAYMRVFKRPSLWVTVGFFIAVAPMAAFGRTEFMFVWLAYVVIAAFSKNPPKIRHLVFLAAGAIALASVLLVFRRLSVGFSTEVFVDYAFPYWAEMVRHTFVYFDHFANYMTVRTALYWDQYGIGHLFSFIVVGFPGDFVPYARGIPATLLRELYSAYSGGAPFTILGILDVTIGSVGALLCMFLYGIFAKLIWDYVRVRRYQISAILILALFDARIFTILSGSYVPGVLQLIQAFLLLAIALILLSGGLMRRPSLRRSFP